MIHSASGGPGAAHPQSPEEEVRDRLARAAGGSDQERLEVLEELYATLEGELEGDLDQEGPPRH